MQEINDEIAELTTLQDLTQAYTQIASTRMVRVRGKVVKTREFLAKINDVFQKVRVSYVHKVMNLAKKRNVGNEEKITFIAHNGLKVAVFLSSRTGLYGEIVPKVFEKFLEALRTENMEVVIVGQLGLNLFRQAEPKMRYTYFDFPDYGFSENEFSEIVEHIVQYEEINVFYGKYYSVLHQQAEKETVSAEISMESSEGRKEISQYIFEPSLEKILIFFESEIFASIFEQAIRESQLAKLASRMLAMDNATNNVREKLKSKQLEVLRDKHKSENKRQINMVAPIFGVY